MKCEIICKECANKSVELHGYGPNTKYQGEYVHHHIGEATPEKVDMPYFRCDMCDKSILTGEQCIAFGIYMAKDEEYAQLWFHKFISDSIPLEEFHSSKPLA